MRILPVVSLLTSALLVGLSANSYGQTQEEASVLEATQVLREIAAVPAAGIPAAILKDAYGVAIIPRMIKGGFVLGARYGRGVLLVRDQNWAWYSPVFISITGGNIGWQAGVKSTDLILVFRTKKSVDGIMAGSFTIGADAAVAAGPVGREVAAATDGSLKAEILTYSRSRGLFAGVSVDGSAIRIDPIANANYYRTAPGAPATVPASSQELVATVVQITGTAVPAAASANSPQWTAAPTLAVQHGPDEATLVRDQLARFAPQLYEHLDPQWQQYLGLPAQIFQGAGHPQLAALDESLARFAHVATNPQYGGLAGRPEFQAVYGLLRHYQQALSGGNQELALPAPPVAN